MHHPRRVAVSVPVFLSATLLSTTTTTSSSSSSLSNNLDIPDELLQLNQPLFLLCSSRKHPERYVLPKGGIEEGETPLQAALREGWEEAGFKGLHLRSLAPSIADTRPSKPSHKSDEVPRAIYDFELCLVTSLEKEWPEMKERTRRWCTRQEMEELTGWRTEVKEGLARVPGSTQELVQLAKEALQRQKTA